MCDCGENDYETDYKAGDIICRQCGVVVESHILDDRLERYTETPRVDCTCGSSSAMLLPQKNVFFDATNLPKRALASVDPFATIREGFKIIDTLGTPFQHSNIVIIAKEVYRDLREFVKTVPTHMAHTYAAGCLYFGCKLEGVGRSEKEIATLLGVDKNDLTTVCKIIKTSLSKKPYGKQLFVGLSSKDLINRAVDRLGLCPKDASLVKKTAHDIDTFVSKSNTLGGKTPAGICGGVVLASLRVCHIDKPKHDVSVACNVAIGTLDRFSDAVSTEMKEKNIP